LSDGDQDRCQVFDCGDEPHATDVNDYIRRKRWLPGRPIEQGLIATTGDGQEMVGFGCWKHWKRGEDEATPEPVIQIQYFGLDRRFHHATLPNGNKVADDLYATLEQDAAAHADSTREMPIDLLCAAENGPGIRFWQRQGFEVLGEIQGGPTTYYWMRRYR